MAPSSAQTRAFVVLSAVILQLACANTRAVAQGTQPALGGGSFVTGGTRVEVGAATIARHHALCARLNKGQRPGQIVLLAWARAIRVEGARALGLAVTDDEFRRWIDTRHAKLNATWFVDGKFSEKGFADYWRGLGFGSEADYIEFCREEMLGDEFIERTHPRIEPTDDAVRRRFESVNSTLAVSAYVFAPETLNDDDAPDIENPEHKALYDKWYETVPDSTRRVYDDINRPALEAEAVTVRFKQWSPDQFKVWFESARPEIQGSFADATKDFEPLPKDWTIMWGRWSNGRKSVYVHVDESLPRRLSDQESFTLARDHLVREFKMIKYMEKLWRELRALPGPVDLKEVARRHALEYVHIPMSIIASGSRPDHANHPLVPGDHPYSLRSIPPGTIYDYNTLPEAYFAEGVVDQPGLHCSIFKLIRAEEMRPVSAAEAIERAWPDFTRDWRWQKAHAQAIAVEKAARAAATERAKTAGGKAADHFSEGLLHAVRESEERRDGARWTGPYYIKPYRSEETVARTDGVLGKRVRNFLMVEWKLWGTADSTFKKGEMLPPHVSRERRILVFPRIDDVVPPAPTLWDRDAAGREHARDAVRADLEAARVERVRADYQWPTILKTFQVDSPSLNAHMANDLATGSRPLQPSK